MLKSHTIQDIKPFKHSIQNVFMALRDYTPNDYPGLIFADAADPANSLYVIDSRAKKELKVLRFDPSTGNFRDRETWRFDAHKKDSEYQGPLAQKIEAEYQRVLELERLAAKG